jgi:3-hydroxyacyl-CoA dehydrogenase
MGAMSMRVVAVIAPGAMGSDVAATLTASGFKVLTLLDGRSAASFPRAQPSGMQASGMQATGLDAIGDRLAFRAFVVAA